MLTELQVKSSKPKEKTYMLRDERGLYLRIDTAGRKYWILRYWENKKERQKTMGAIFSLRREITGGVYLKMALELLCVV